MLGGVLCGNETRSDEHHRGKRGNGGRLNALLHEYGEFIIGRMGIPYRKRGVSVIAIAVDAPQNTIAALSGKIGGLVGVSVKTAYSGVISKE